MLHKFLLATLIFSSLFVNAQKGTIKGKITDAATGEGLIQANVLLKEGVGVTTDMDGNFSIEADYGTYTITISYSGYEPLNEKVTLRQPVYNLNLLLKARELKEVVITADPAVERKTPVAFSKVDAKGIQEDLASRDMVLALNATPGVYATNKGGGDGDATITIRGFNQNNVAVMIDGVPVNDMENGEVYWSNWMGLDAVTRSMQVQRGLGASKLALPSVGGTINILTTGIRDRSELAVKQEFANNEFFRTSVMFNSGRLPKGWGVSVAGSYRQGDGWVSGNDIQGGFYYAKVEKMFKEGKHLISVSAFGAPQVHGQRFSQQPILAYDSALAGRKFGIDVTDAIAKGNFRFIDQDFTFNPTWGDLDRRTFVRNDQGVIVDTVSSGKTSRYNTSQNVYHKPQVIARYSFQPNDKFFLSGTFYTSIGKGGGTQIIAQTLRYDSLNQLNVQSLYDENLLYKSGQGSNYIRRSTNNHYWYGGLVTMNYKLPKGFDISGGLDFRSYKGEHYQEVFDLLGGKYIIIPTSADQNGQRRDTLVEGGKVGRFDYGFVNWGGGFVQAEWSNKKISAFVNVSAAGTFYLKEDRFAKKSLKIDDEIVAKEAIGFYDVAYYNGTDVVIAGQNAVVTQSGDTTFVKNGSNAVEQIIGAKAYNNASKEAVYSRTPLLKLPSATIKAGVNYNINEQHSVFVNGGYLYKAPFYNFLIPLRGLNLTTGIKNEEIVSAEVGYLFRSRWVSATVNAYYTEWLNKPYTNTFTDPNNIEDRELVYVPGIKARHVGGELDFAVRPHKMVTIEGIFSYGDWVWNSDVKFRWIFQSGTDTVLSFNPKGVHVGGSAQMQVGGMVRIEPIKGLYIKPRITYFDKFYADFNPETLSGANAGRESWKLPGYYTLDVSAGYTYTLKKEWLFTVRANFFNITNRNFIQDATNNNAFFREFDAKSASVFFGQGFRWNIGIEIAWVNFIKKKEVDR
jgi:iron complex outermembrane receptor protein